MAKKSTKKESKTTCMNACKGVGMYIPAGLFLGIGIGMLIGEPGAGTLIGLGAGFVAMIIDKRNK